MVLLKVYIFVSIIVRIYLHVNIQVNMYMYEYVFTYNCIHIHACMYTYMFLYTCTFIYTYMYININQSLSIHVKAVYRGRKCRRGSISMKIPSDLDYDNDTNKENLKISQGKDECTNYEKNSIISNITTIEPFGNGSNFDIKNKTLMINLLKKKYLYTVETLEEQISIIEKLENNDFEKFIHKNFKNENKNENDKIIKKYLSENIIQHCLSLNDNEINVNQIFRDNFRKLM